MAAATTSPGDAGQAAGAKPSSRVEPQEVGWMFVPQYYSLLNKDPGRLHCFYQKRSTLIHSVEGEEAETRYGQQEIHDRIMELGFEDAKVYVSNVDSQPSADGGIIVQVIGEMSNRAGAWRKFAQTFFLAEQPNGYFVLNDIFRFIKEDQDSGDEQTAPAAVSAAPQESAAATAAAHHFQAPSASAQAPAQPSYDFAAQQPRAPVARTPSPQPPTQAAEESARPQVNGWHDSTSSAAAASAPSPPVPARAPTPPAPAQPTTEAIEQPSTVADVVPSAPEASTSSSAAAEVESKPAESAQPAAAAAPAAAAEPAAPAPAASKSKPSWASLAANASGTGSKWSSAVVSGHSGVVSMAPPQQTRAEQPAAPAQSTSAPTGAYNHQRQPFNPASITTGQCFVKGVIDALPVPVLRAALQERFGTVKELDLIRGKACAFLEFATVDSAREAIRVSQSQRDGGEGGIPIPETGLVVHVEIRRSKDEVAAYQASRGIVRNFDSSRGGYDSSRGRGAPRGRGGAAGSRPPPSSGPRPAGGAPSGGSSATPSSSGQPRAPRA